MQPKTVNPRAGAPASAPRPRKVEFAPPAVPRSAERVSDMACGMVGSEILRISAEIRALQAKGVPVCNLTVGDFSPTEFRIPQLLERRIEEALRAGETHYPPSDGLPALRKSVVDFYARALELEYPVASVLVGGGARPLIYAGFRVLVNPGDRVIYPVPSWNNNHYCHLVGAQQVRVPASSAEAFLPTRKLLEPAVAGARLLALNSPLNPAGTAFTAEALGEICDLVLEENRRRGPGERPLYVLYDQVYWMLTFDGLQHVNPVSLRPAMAPYTLLIDGISKSFAATGLRVGWAVGPPDVMPRMADIVGHMGAWAPRPEQVATAALLADAEEIARYHAGMTHSVQLRLDALYSGLLGLRRDGFRVDAIAPMSAIYLSARFDLAGRRAPGTAAELRTNDDIRRYLLESAGLAMVPFQAFGMEEDSGWFRLSVGAVSPEQIAEMLPRLRNALEALAH